MKIGSLWIIHKKSVKKIKYHGIEFDPKKIERCTKELEKLLDQGYVVSESYQTEFGLVHELLKF